MRPASVSNVEETTIVLRRADGSDLNFVRSLCRLLFLAYGSYHEYVEGWFGDDAIFTWIAEVDGAKAGFVMFTVPPKASVADLVAIAVSPGARSRGVGKALLSKCLDVLRESPRVEEVRLQVAEGNSRAQRMFAGSGFRFRPETGVYPAGQRALFMVKALTREVLR